MQLRRCQLSQMDELNNEMRHCSAFLALPHYRVTHQTVILEDLMSIHAQLNTSEEEFGASKTNPPRTTLVA